MSDTTTATPKKRGRKPAQDKPSAPEREERVVWLPLGELHPFKGYPALRGIMPGNQPYHVRDDDPSMLQITATVKERGVRQPGLARPDPEGGYEIIAGERRHRASELAGLKDMPVIIREMSDEEAVTELVDSNIQREDVLKWMKQIAPPSVEKRMTLVMDNLRYAVGGYFKAQFKIMGVVFLILLVGFAVLGVRYFVLVAFLISFLDFLPFFGTGTAMIPWGIYKFLMGDYKMAILLIAIYAVTQLVRQLLQPKLVADSVGMNPLVTLLLLYIGYRIGSVLGMILAVPVGMVLINMLQAGAFDYILDDVRILVDGILELRNPPKE